MIRRAVPALLLTLACEGGIPTDPRFTQDVVPSSTVVDRLDPARTYEYRFATARPESLLAALLDAGIPVEEAWLPLDNLCADPRGPVFTVALAYADARILAFDFDPGTGRLACATRLERYRVT